MGITFGKRLTESEMFERRASRNPLGLRFFLYNLEARHQPFQIFNRDDDLPAFALRPHSIMRELAAFHPATNDAFAHAGMLSGFGDG